MGVIPNRLALGWERRARPGPQGQSKRFKRSANGDKRPPIILIHHQFDLAPASRSSLARKDWNIVSDQVKRFQ